MASERLSAETQLENLKERSNMANEITQEDLESAKRKFFEKGGKIDKIPPQEIKNDFNPATFSDSAKNSGRISANLHIPRM
jgi:hypothetical protein